MRLATKEEEEKKVPNGSASPASAPQGFLSEVFGGQLSSQVACQACDYTSVTLEPFMDLSLPIPSGSVADSDLSAPERYHHTSFVSAVAVEQPVNLLACLDGCLLGP